MKERIFQLDKKCSILPVTISDTTLVASINRFVAEQTEKDTAFRHIGYLQLTQKKTPDKTYYCCFHLGRRYYYFYPDFHDERFPLFYSFVGGKMVLIYLEGQSALGYKLTKHSKKKFIRLVNQQLPKIEKQVLQTETGKKVLLPVGWPVLESGSTTICGSCIPAY